MTLLAETRNCDGIMPIVEQSHTTASNKKKAIIDFYRNKERELEKW